MTQVKQKEDFRSFYEQLVKQNLRHSWLYAAGVIFFFSLIGFYSKIVPAAILGSICLFFIYLLHRRYTHKYYRRLALLNVPFPEAWQTYLEDNAAFYANLTEEDKQVFNKRIQFFLAEKKIEGVSTDIDDPLKLLVAASAVIPTFAFPFFEYPNLRQVLIYPNSFDKSFQTESEAPQEQNIAGMVGNGFMNKTLLLSKPDLIAGFKGKNTHNVGIHEFVHLLDMADGAVDGMPEIFVANSYALPWLQVIKAEVKRIKKGDSDINPYSLTSNAEFLAVVSEYFFDNPEKLEAKHPELYQSLCTIFHQAPHQNR